MYLQNFLGMKDSKLHQNDQKKQFWNFCITSLEIESGDLDIFSYELSTVLRLQLLPIYGLLGRISQNKQPKIITNNRFFKRNKQIKNLFLT